MLRLHHMLASVALLASLSACGSRVLRAGPGGPAPDVTDEFTPPPPDVTDEFTPPPPPPPPPDVTLPDVTDEFEPPPDITPPPPPPDVVPPPPDVLPPPPDVFPPPPDVLPPPPDVTNPGSCESAPTLPPSMAQTLFADISFATDRLPQCMGSFVRGGPVRYYRVIVPAGQALEARSPRGPDGAVPLLRLLQSCAPTSCVAQNTFGPTGAELRWNNTSGRPAPVVLAVTYDGTTPSSTLVPVTVSLRAPASNQSCATAQRLTPSVPVSGTSTGDAMSPPLACPELPGSPANALWYRVTVPAGQTVSVSMSSSEGAPPSFGVRLYAGCMTTSCLGGSTSSLDGRSVVARWSNTGAAPVEVFAAVGGNFPGAAPARFDLVATLAAAPPNVTCARALDVADGTVLRGQDPTAASERQAPCPGMSGTPTPVLWYRATVPAGQTLSAAVSPAGGVPARGAPFLRVVPDCTSPFCYAASTATSTGGTALSWTNPSPTPLRVLVTVGFQTPAFSSPFDLSVRIRAAATNGACATPLRITSGTTLPAENLSDAREPSFTCGGGAFASGALYYVVRVEAGAQLVAVASRVDSPGAQVQLRLTETCVGGSCLGQSITTPTPGGTVSRLTFTNTGPARDLILVLSPPQGAPPTPGIVSLTVSSSLPPYAITNVGTQCDDMAAATVSAEAVGDDVGTRSQPIGFTFPFFGQPMTGVSLSTNGYLQVWPVAGMSSGALGAAEFPSAMAPTNAIAAFWDDLFVPVGTTDVRTRLFPAPSPRFVAQWTNVSFCCSDGPDRLTFQIKLFPSGVIEYHYCALSGSPRAFGSGASIGMQDATTTRGVSYAVRRPGAVSPMAALRFTPR